MHQQSQPSPRARLTAVACWLLLVGALLVAPVPPASAGSTYLCSGYDACKSAGYPHAGYKGQAGTMWWRMYSGHNCTNYVAYRMVRGGLPNTRPWTGSGNASNWGAAMSRITDGTPMVGSVAWWKANAPGAGSSGHVAYVEEVVGTNQIRVSEDSWGGDFHWRTITRSGKGWPSGFIHFNDATVTPTAPPVVTGTPVVGEPVQASAGGWRPAASTTLQWLADGQPVAGATGLAFTPPPALRGKQLALRVTASKPGYVASSAASAPTAQVAPGTLQRQAAPVISGVAEVDQVLEATPGSWTPVPARTTVQWHADGAPIEGATSWRLVLGQAHADRVITAVVSATAPGYRKSVVSSAPTAPVLAGTIQVTRPFRLAGVPRHGTELSVRPGAFAPADARVSYTWMRDGQPVPGAVGPTYAVGAADLGSRLSVRAVLARPGFRSAAETLQKGRPVTTASTLQVRTRGKPRRAVVTLRVTAPGVAAPTGTATVRVGGRQVVAEVVGGRARVVVSGLGKGRKQVRVSYAGTHVVRPSRAAGSVWVQRSAR